MIPKIIWQTHQWKEDKLPYPYNKTILAWKNLFLDWDYNYCDRFKRIEMVKELDPDNLIFFLDLSKTRQSDYWRYLTMYHYGGLYVDADCIPTGTGITLFDDELYEYGLIVENVPVNDFDSDIPNGYFLCEPGNKVLGYIVENYFDLVLQKGLEGSDMTSIWSKAIRESSDQDNILYTKFGFLSNIVQDFPYDSEIQYKGQLTKYSDIDFMTRT